MTNLKERIKTKTNKHNLKRKKDFGVRCIDMGLGSLFNANRPR